MRVRALKIEMDKLSPRIRSLLGEDQIFLTPSNEYDVHAISVVDGMVDFQIVDDHGYIYWVPYILFEVLDGTLMHDWVYNQFSQLKGIDTMLIGPKFMVQDKESFVDMVERNPDQVQRFWERIDSLSRRDDSDD
jgi:hypothetical protein